MTTGLRLIAVVVSTIGILVEYYQVLSAPGLALLAGVLLGTYIWFFATSRSARAPIRRTS
jgi:hypothetical protein